MMSDAFLRDLGQTASGSGGRGREEQFLRFYLEPDTKVMLPVAQLTEVLTIPLGQIIPIPHMPAWVMGVYNWRGEILWMVDLGQLVGLTPWHQQSFKGSTYRAFVLKSAGKSETAAKSQTLGLVISRVDDIEWCDPAQIQSPPASAVEPGLAPFLRGFWVKPDGEILVALEGEAIMAAMPKS
ncbi:MAG: chemotaxis protein CheW [Hydrococcus sp. C42_A2020_068]|uniref:Chemotaxis protein CheW n=1 Tax=Hydrococcus rivularis NIES-593 TaxID=1921803 RepID=A0A1U7HPV6_9CYAN|nr:MULTISPECIES: chemotaxis protein CheW [Pleurocapsales]AFY77719.1 chemotaxis signal transduction protein [Pleurocapsa sp. PCC 7327]MBF2019689.1 chemotaxis protein CheW [Hydrococcus sp. C42_A2020_068]OKH25633.1 chemotaxis protein CheW [Hydrococcus rivularis NIES-593]